MYPFENERRQKNSEEKSKEEGINLDELQCEAEKLVSLLKDRNPGLMTWNDSLSKQLKSLRDLLS